MTRKEYTLLWKHRGNELGVEIMGTLPTSDTLRFVVSCGHISHLSVLPLSVLRELCPRRSIVSLVVNCSHVGYSLWSHGSFVSSLAIVAMSITPQFILIMAMSVTS